MGFVWKKLLGKFEKYTILELIIDKYCQVLNDFI